VAKMSPKNFRSKKRREEKRRKLLRHPLKTLSSSGFKKIKAIDMSFESANATQKQRPNASKDPRTSKLNKKKYMSFFLIRELCTGRPNSQPSITPLILETFAQKNLLKRPNN
jgi:hypothetical protein